MGGDRWLGVWAGLLREEEFHLVAKVENYGFKKGCWLCFLTHSYEPFVACPPCLPWDEALIDLTQSWQQPCETDLTVPVQRVRLWPWRVQLPVQAAHVHRASWY